MACYEYHAEGCSGFEYECINEDVWYLITCYAILSEIPRSSLAQIVNVAEDDFMSPSKVAMNSNNSTTSFHVPKDLWLDLAPTGTPRSDSV